MDEMTVDHQEENALDFHFSHAVGIGSPFHSEPTVQIGECAYSIYDPEVTFLDWVHRYANALGRDPTPELQFQNLLLIISLSDPDERQLLLKHTDHILSLVGHPHGLILNHGLVDLAKQHPKWPEVRQKQPFPIYLPTGEYVPMTNEQWAQLVEDFQNAGFVGFALPFAPLFYRIGILCQAIREKPNPPNILIYGDTGSGKEVMARAIHRISERPGRFEALNCGSADQELLDSDLFGHVEGAYTGAIADRDGLFLTCHEGTALMDEITRMPRDCQHRLLRFTNDKQLKRLGEDESRPVDVVLISACNQDPEEGDSALPHDLYLRLAQHRIDLPSLRERSGDVAQLVRTFLEKREVGRRIWDYRYPVALWFQRQVEAQRITSIRDLEATVARLADNLEPLKELDPLKRHLAKAEAEKRRLGRQLKKKELAGALGISESTLYEEKHRAFVQACVDRDITKPTMRFPKINR